MFSNNWLRTQGKKLKDNLLGRDILFIGQWAQGKKKGDRRINLSIKQESARNLAICLL